MKSSITERAEELNKRLAAVSLAGLWQQSSKRLILEPHVWQWKDVYPCLMEAGEIVGLGEEAERRVVKLVNPTLHEQRATSRTLQMSFQLIKPGETAACHRHSIAALRFIIEGRGAYTTVEGERMLMEPGDLILTPSWTWHDHTNSSNEPIVWLDGLDSPLAVYFQAAFQELYGGGSKQPISKPDGFGRHKFGAVRPMVASAIERQPPPYTYKWSDTLEALRMIGNSGEHDPYDGLILRYVNPVTGGYTMPTISCQVQMLRPGEVTGLHRHTETVLYHVVQGEGVTKVGRDSDDKDMEWAVKDCFIIPPWSWHQLHNSSTTEPVILFSMSDRPIFEALGLYREEVAEVRDQ
jgi:gentisate 1,2-dioxygenase